MNLRVACLIVWSVGLGVALCLLLGRGIAEDLPPCDGTTSKPGEKCGQDIPCQTYYDSNDNSIQDPDAAQINCRTGAQINGLIDSQQGA